MSEFCLDCYNKYDMACRGVPLTEKDVILGLDFCEECGEWKQCVMYVKPKDFHEWLERKRNGIFCRLYFLKLNIKEKFNKKN